MAVKLLIGLLVWLFHEEELSVEYPSISALRPTADARLGDARGSDDS